MSDNERIDSGAPRRKKKKNNALAVIIPFLVWLFSIVAVAEIHLLGVLPGLYFLAVIAIFVLLGLLCTVFRRSPAGMLLGLLYALVLAFAIYAVGKANGVLDYVTQEREVYVDVSVYVKKDDTARTLEDVAQRSIAILADNDRANTDQAVSALEDALGNTVTLVEYPSIGDVIMAMEMGEIDTALLNEAYCLIYDDALYDMKQAEAASLIDRASIEELTENSLRTVYTVKLQAKSQTVNAGELTNVDSELFAPESEPVQTPSATITTEPFVVYLSGSDTRAQTLDVNTRSDVNILAVVNPVTKTVLLVNTPRDYYVPLKNSSGNRDKLTHAGLYGVENSIDTLEMLYNLDDVSYWAKINFRGFEQIVDALGGVTVWSDYEFISSIYRNEGTMGWDYCQYKEGWNENLNGVQALFFVRERFSFDGSNGRLMGDFQRGQNQMYMLNAILNKVKSPAVLTGYGALMDAIADCFQTNIPRNDIEALVQMQLKDGASWTIDSIMAEGYTGMRACWSSGSTELSVVIPEDESVMNVRDKIQQVMNGTYVSEAENQMPSNEPASEPESSEPVSSEPESSEPVSSEPESAASVPAENKKISSGIERAVLVVLLVVTVLTVLLLLWNEKQKSRRARIRRNQQRRPK